MADDLRDRLIDNLEEVDKSLRRSYIFQIILCLLFLYLFYNAAAVSDQTKSITQKISDTRCVKGEFEKVHGFVREFGRDRFGDYVKYNLNIRELTEQFHYRVKDTGQYERKSNYDEQLHSIAANRLAAYSQALEDAIINAKAAAENIENLKLANLIEYVRILTFVDPLMKEGVKNFLARRQDRGGRLPDSSFLNSKSELLGIQDISKAKRYLDHSCTATRARSMFEQTREIRFLDRLGALERIRTELDDKNEVLIADIVNHERKLTEQHRKLQDANIAEINIPLAGQSMNVSFAFRIGPFVILLIQFLICSYFRHRYDLIKKIKSSFDTDAKPGKVEIGDIHLLLWPWILNFPYYKSDKYRAERQKGAAIIEILLSFFQFLPVLTIAIIAVRPIYFGTTGSIETPEITPTDWIFIAAAAILLIVTFLQVRYSRRLDWQITELLEWKQVEAHDVPSFSGTAAARWKLKFLLLIIIGIIANFQLHVGQDLKIDTALIPSILTLYAGYRFGRIKGLIFGVGIAAPWVILNVSMLVESYGLDPTFLTRPLSLGALTIPHSSVLALERLALLGYFSGWIFERIRRGLFENRIPMDQIYPVKDPSDFSIIKQLFIGAGTVMLIIAANIDIWWFPRGLPMVVLALAAYRRGPVLGVAAGMISIIISALPLTAIDSPFYYRNFYSILAFGLIGYWSGCLGRVFKYRRREIQDIGTNLSLWKTDSARMGMSLPILIVFLAISAFLYYTLNSDGVFSSSLRIVLLPLPTVAIMLIGSLYGSRKAVWIAAISIGTFFTISYFAYVLGWNFEYRISEDIIFGIGIFRWSFVSIAIYIAAAYWSGKIDLQKNKANQYGFAIAVFAVFQLASILRKADFLSLSSILGRVGEIRLDVFTSPLQLLEPWLTVILFNIFMNWLNGDKEKS